MTSVGHVGTGDRSDDDNGGFKLRPQDQRILELNQQGYSAKKISDILKREGMPLSKTSVSNHLKEMRLDPDNDVQVNHNGGVRSETVRKNQRWYKIIEWVIVYAKRYYQRNHFKIAIRTAFYDATDLNPPLVEEHEYNQFVSKLADARIGYVDQNGELLLPELDPELFADDDSRETYNRYDATEPEPVGEPGPIPDSNEHIDRYIRWLKNAPAEYEGKGTKGTDGEIGGYWYNQPEYAEVWQEKNDLMEGFDAILKDLHVKIRGNKGYSSFSFLYKCTQELKEFIDRTGIEPENIWILYCGDWDPSGENIDYYLQRRFRQLGLTGINFKRVAVTPEQIDKYNFSLLSIGQRPGKKGPNPNMREFVRRHGYKATHLNAFFTEAHLPVFREILRNAVLEHWDENIYNEMVEEYDVEADAPPRFTDEELSKRRRNMYRRIAKAFSDPNWCSGLPDAPDPDDIDEEEDEDDDSVIYPGIDE